MLTIPPLSHRSRSGQSGRGYGPAEPLASIRAQSYLAAHGCWTHFIRPLRRGPVPSNHTTGPPLWPSGHSRCHHSGMYSRLPLSEMTTWKNLLIALCVEINCLNELDVSYIIFRLLYSKWQALLLIYFQAFFS